MGSGVLLSQVVAAPAIFAFTLYLILARPRNLDTGVAAMVGAMLALLAGVITLADVRTVAGIVWDATFALIAIVVISVVLDQAGLFRWAALQMARRAGGNGRSIFLSVILLGAVVSTLFTNDATVLILTPIVYEMLAALGFDNRMMLPYMMACGFVADSMSIPLAVSNLTNMITARYFALDFGRFALLMLLPAVVCLGATVLVLRWYYRREIPSRYDGSGQRDRFGHRPEADAHRVAGDPDLAAQLAATGNEDHLAILFESGLDHHAAGAAGRPGCIVGKRSVAGIEGGGRIDAAGTVGTGLGQGRVPEGVYAQTAACEGGAVRPVGPGGRDGGFCEGRLA